MSTLWTLIPPDLEPLQMRSDFLLWLRSQPLSFHTRLEIYFRWLDYHAASYTADEIDSLKD